MFRRGLLIVITLLVIFGFVANGYAANSYANTPNEQPSHQTPLPAQPIPVPLTTFPTVVVVISSANVRAGPGTDYAVISAARPGQRLSVLGCNDDCSWYRLANDCWIAAFLVKPEQPLTYPAGAAPQPTPDPRLPIVIVNIPITVTGGALQPTRCPQTVAAVNTYAGPGTYFTVVESIPAGQCVAVVGRNTLGDWFQLSKGMWILAGAVIYAEPLETMPVTDRIFTATPEPPPTPVGPNITAEEQEYIDFLLAQAQIYETSWAALASQATLLIQNPLLISTADWRNYTQSALTFILVTNENVRVRAAPPRFLPVQAQMLSAADQYDLAVALITEAINTGDASRVAAAQQNIIDGTNAVLRAKSIIEQIRIDASPPAQAIMVAATPVAAVVSSAPSSSSQGCDPNYSGACVPHFPPDVNCGSLPKNFSRVGNDPHELDRDNDGIACEED